METNRKLIEKIASISRLNLTESEVNEFLPQLREILNAFSKIKEVNTEKIKPSFQPLEIKNIYREDKIEKCLSQEEALKNTKHKEDGFFKGPKTIWTPNNSSKK